MKPQREKPKPPKPQSPPLLGCREVAEWLGISAASLSRMVHSNRVPHVLIGTGKKKLIVRFREAELLAWLDRRSRGAVPKPRSNLSSVDKNSGGSAQHLENKESALFLETSLNADSRLNSGGIADRSNDFRNARNE